MIATRARAATPARLSSLSLERVLVMALLGLALLQVGVLLYHLALTVTFPYDLDYGEGYVLNDAVRLAHGQPIYTDIQQFPMVRSPYPPLFPVLWSLLVPVAGAVFWPGRLLAALALLATAGLLAWNARQAGAGWLPAVLAPAVLLASPFVYDWAGYSRVDTLGLLFATAAVLAAQWSRGWRSVLVAAALAGLALWTKQSLVAAPLAVTLALFAQDWRRGVAFVVALALPSAVLLLVLQAGTGGEFARHVLQGNAQNPFSPVRALGYVLVFAVQHLPVLLAAAYWLRQGFRGIPSPVTLYALFALLGALTVGNEGSGVNYLIEPLIGSLLVLPFAWRSLGPRATAIGMPLAIAQLVLLFHWPNGVGLNLLPVAPESRTPDAQDAAVGAQVDALVAGAPGPVLSEAAGFGLRQGRPVYVQPIDLRAEQALGRWSSAPLVRSLSDGTFPLVVTVYNLLPSDAEQAIQQHYVVSQVLPSDNGLTYRVYRYRG